MCCTASSADSTTIYINPPVLSSGLSLISQLLRRSDRLPASLANRAAASIINRDPLELPETCEAVPEYDVTVAVVCQLQRSPACAASCPSHHRHHPLPMARGSGLCPDIPSRQTSNPFRLGRALRIRSGVPLLGYPLAIAVAIGWSNKRIFKLLRGELATLTDRAFERGALPFLRTVYPELVNPPARRDFDIAGADHLVWSDTPPFPLVVQCKGFEAHEWELGSAQVQQCIRSIRAFRDSGFKTKLYLLAHNRTSKDPGFRRDINEELKDLVASGSASRAQLWDVDTIVKQALTAMHERLRKLAREHNLSVVKEYENAEPDLCEPLQHVPLRASVLTADQNRLTKGTEGREEVADPARVLRYSDKHFSLLVGYAGFGKTTAALRVTQAFGLKTFFVPAARLTRVTTKELLEHCIDVEPLIADCLPEDVATVRKLAKLAIEHFFKTDDESYVLLLDGIDESFVLSRRGGLQQLFNALRHVRSRMILTVRKEFLEVRTADFATSFGLVTNRKDRVHNQTIRLVELLPWSDEQILSLIRRFADSLGSEPRVRIMQLADTVGSGEYRAFYGDIPRRPLFLRFILETVAASGVHRVNRSTLFEEWGRLKVVRDFARPAQFGGRRMSIALEASIDDTVELAFEAMSWAARCMTTVNDRSVELLPTCRISDVLALRSLRDKSNAEGIILNSLLVPAGPRLAPAPLEVRFAHRAYQEFFLARFIRDHPKTFEDATLPDSIHEWLNEVR